MYIFFVCIIYLSGTPLVYFQQNKKSRGEKMSRS